MQTYTREYFDDKVLILRRQEQLDTILKSFNFKDSEINVKNFPMIVYQGMLKSIDVSEITESNLTKLKFDKDFSKSVIELV